VSIKLKQPPTITFSPGPFVLFVRQSKVFSINQNVFYDSDPHVLTYGVSPVYELSNEFPQLGLTANKTHLFLLVKARANGRWRAMLSATDYVCYQPPTTSTRLQRLRSPSLSKAVHPKTASSDRTSTSKTERLASITTRLTPIRAGDSKSSRTGRLRTAFT